jgi:hypothetical protein
MSSKLYFSVCDGLPEGRLFPIVELAIFVRVE